jgi:uncharacterized damage-inducible protein DinB
LKISALDAIILNAKRALALGAGSRVWPSRHVLQRYRLFVTLKNKIHHKQTVMKKLLTVTMLMLSLNAFCQGQLQKEASGNLTFSSGQVMQLAQVIPAEKYSWTPQAGVRSFAEVFAHIISANYFFASKLGAKIPEGVKMETLEKDLKTKDAIAGALKQSYESIINAIKNIKDGDLAKKIEFPFPGEYTDMSAVLIAAGHSDEHLGQLIAYARMNGITPPWSQAK